MISEGRSQLLFPTSPRLDLQEPGLSSPLPSNSVSHIAVQGSVVWIGTSKGAARSHDGGRSWESFAGVPAFARPGIFALAVRDDTIWCSTGFTQDIDGSNIQTGAGYAYTTDDAATWISAEQPLDAEGDSLVQYGVNTVRFLPVTVREQNVTFDIGLTTGTVWVASWSSGLRRSTDLGATWNRIVLPNDDISWVSPSDSLGDYVVNPVPVDNFKAFSILGEDDSTIWVGTAGGINRSTDGGSSWRKFRSDNQDKPILSNWVIAVAAQQLGQSTRIWTTNWIAEGPGQRYGVSYTDDGGASWTNILVGVKAYSFGFKDSVVYIPTTEGIYRTHDGGKSFDRSGTIVDRATGQRITSNTFFSVGVLGDTVFAGGADGLVKTVDNVSHPFGQTWEIFRAYEPITSEVQSYAYPNPFSPRFDVTRIHYALPTGAGDVTIEIFDFGMNRVRTVIRDAPRSGGTEYDEVWDGRDDNGSVIPNGVYFYRVTIGGAEPKWGKILVLA
jgi:hypothetical protein